MVLDGETLRAKSTLPKTAPGNEHSAVPSRAILSISGRTDEAVELKPSGRSNAEYEPQGTSLSWKGKRKVYREGKRKMEEKHEIRVGTWNVQTMNAMGKLEKVKEEMRRNRLSIMGVSEVRWKDGGDFVSDGYRVMYVGGPTCQRGVAVIAEAKVGERVTEIDRFGDRIMVVKVKADPVDMVIVQAWLHDKMLPDKMLPTKCCRQNVYRQNVYRQNVATTKCCQTKRCRQNVYRQN